MLTSSNRLDPGASYLIAKQIGKKNFLHLPLNKVKSIVDFNCRKNLANALIWENIDSFRVRQTWLAQSIPDTTL